MFVAISYYVGTEPLKESMDNFFSFIKLIELITEQNLIHTNGVETSSSTSSDTLIPRVPSASVSNKISLTFRMNLLWYVVGSMADKPRKFDKNNTVNNEQGRADLTN